LQCARQILKKRFTKTSPLGKGIKKPLTVVLGLWVLLLVLPGKILPQTSQIDNSYAYQNQLSYEKFFITSDTNLLRVNPVNQVYC
jgi:hypothetical protein